MTAHANQSRLQSLQCWLLLAAIAVAGAARAEQKLEFDGFELHYVVIPTAFLSADVAERYQVVRGEGRALVNLSLLKDGKGVQATSLEGSVKNLLSQTQPLDFQEVTEGDAVYYLAQLRHSDRDTLTFNVEISAEGLATRTLSFRQKLYRDGTAPTE